MNESMIWFLAALAFVMAELMTGTFYLLMVAIGCLVGAGIAFAGAALPLQFVGGAAVGIVATMLLRRTRWGERRRLSDPAENRDVILDIGEVVEVASWNEGTAHVRYRGCQWDATLEAGAIPRPGAQVIKAIRGSTLVVAPVVLNG